MFPVGKALSYPNLGPFFQEEEHLKFKQLASTGCGKHIYAILFIEKKPVAFWNHLNHGCLLQHICQAEKELTYNVVILYAVCASSIFSVVYMGFFSVCWWWIGLSGNKQILEYPVMHLKSIISKSDASSFDFKNLLQNLYHMYYEKPLLQHCK